MMRARYAAIGLAVIAGAGGAAWFAMRAPVSPPLAPQPMPASPIVAAAEVVRASTPEAVPASGPAESELADSEPAESQPAASLQWTLSPTGSAALFARARGGDVQAMSDLGYTLLQCQGNAQARRAMLIRQAESDYRLDVQMRTRTIEAIREWDTYCATIPAEERARGLAWIETAAATGDADARRHFFANALAEFADETAILANIDEVERRRDVARRFAREDLAACVQGVFDLQSEAFDLLGMADPVERLAMLHASVLSQPHGEYSNTADAFEQEARAVDEAALIEARRRGAAMHAYCAP